MEPGRHGRRAKGGLSHRRHRGPGGGRVSRRAAGGMPVGPGRAGMVREVPGLRGYFTVPYFEARSAVAARRELQGCAGRPLAAVAAVLPPGMAGRGDGIAVVELSWQGRQDSNLRRTGLESAALAGLSYAPSVGGACHRGSPVRHGFCVGLALPAAFGALAAAVPATAPAVVVSGGESAAGAAASLPGLPGCPGRCPACRWPVCGARGLWSGWR